MEMPFLGFWKSPEDKQRAEVRFSEIESSAKSNKLYSGVDKVDSAVRNVVTAPINFFNWIDQHWQLAIIGLVAIVVLLKD